MTAHLGLLDNVGYYESSSKAIDRSLTLVRSSMDEPPQHRNNDDVNSLYSSIKALENIIRSHMLYLDGIDGIGLPGPLQPFAGLPPAAAASPAVAGNDNKPEIIRRKDKVTVLLHMTFMKIGVIDTIKDRFSAEVRVVSRWREPRLDGQKQNVDGIKWNDYWNPKLTLENGIGDVKISVVPSVVYDKAGKATVYESRVLGGTFFEFMELNKFPFDSQDVTVTLVSERGVTEVDLVADPTAKNSINPKGLSAVQEWHLLDKLNTSKKTVTKKVNNKTTKHPGFSVGAKAVRRPQYYLFNIIIILSTICSMAFATFSVAVNLPQGRLPLTFLLLLTTVTFKFVVNKLLPKISYLTIMDKYILGSMIILISINCWHALVGGLINPVTLRAATEAASTAVTSTTPLPTSTGASTKELITGNFTRQQTTAAPRNAPVDATTTSASSAACPTSMPATTAAPAAKKISSAAKAADTIALAVLASLFVGLHIVLFGPALLKCDGKDGDEQDLEA